MILAVIKIQINSLKPDHYSDFKNFQFLFMFNSCSLKSGLNLFFVLLRKILIQLYM